MEWTIDSKMIHWFNLKGILQLHAWKGLDANCCISSMMHHVLLQWKANIVPADTTINMSAIDFDPWQMEGMDCLSKCVWDGQYLNVTNQGVEILDRKYPVQYL
jgi:hypothetical protein